MICALTPRRQVTGVDIFLNRENVGDDDDSDDDDDGGEAEGIQEFVKKRWNLNASFRDDRSEDRLRPETFDLINSRLLAEGIQTNRWESYVGQLKEMLKPGGWLQMLEIDLSFQSWAGLPVYQQTRLDHWWQLYARRLEDMGKDVRIGGRLRSRLRDARFVGVEGRTITVPIGDWNPGKLKVSRLSAAVDIP